MIFTVKKTYLFPQIFSAQKGYFQNAPLITLCKAMVAIQKQNIGHQRKISIIFFFLSISIKLTSVFRCDGQKGYENVWIVNFFFHFEKFE